MTNPVATPATEKWRADSIGPRQLKAFNEALGRFSWESKTITELTDHGQHDVTPMFSGQANPLAAELMTAIKTGTIGCIVTGANYQRIVKELDAATAKMAANRPVVDTRSTPEERAERERILLEAERKRQAEAARIAQFESHNFGLAETAKEIKRVLGVIFPATRFSVKSEAYSMGCSIDATWTDGPTGEQVKPILDCFERCGFDGMQDLKTYNETPEWNGHRFHFTGDYVRGNRNLSAALYAEACERFSGETGRAAPAIKGDGKYIYLERQNEPSGFKYFAARFEDADCIASDSMGGDSADTVVNQIAHHISKEQPAAPISYRQSDEDGAEPALSVRSVVFGVLLGSVKPVQQAATPTALDSDGVTVSENDEKDGIEIRFPGKPASEVLDRLKANGWRWSRFSKCWYAKRTSEARAFADSFAEVQS